MSERTEVPAADTQRTGRRWLVSIRSQMLLWFLAIAIIPVVIVGVIAYGTASDTVQAMVTMRLESIARARAMALETFAGERMRLLRSVARAPGLVARVKAGPAAAAGDSSETSFLHAFEESFEFHDLVLVDATGRIVATTRQPAVAGTALDQSLLRDTALPAAIERVRRTAEPMMAPPDARGGGRPSTWVVGPILDGNVTIGAIAVELPQAEIDRLVNERAGLGSSGEVIVASSTAQGWLAAAPMRERPDAAGSFVFPKASGVITRLSEAASGREGSGRSTSADGTPVLAAWTRVPSFGWALTAEQSMAEAFAPVRSLRDTIILAIMAASVVALSVALGVSRTLSRPLGDAVTATRRIAEGDLTALPAISGHGETRVLLRAIRDTNTDLAKLIGRIRETAGQIVRSSGTVRGVARDQDQAVRDFAASSAQVASATSQMNATSRQLSATMIGLSRAAEFAANTATSGRTSLVDLGKQMGRLNEGGRSVATRLEAIRDRAARIDSMVAAITKVANQTNLLAVNAAIEAEKAGAAGHGFQVVAREIDRLATQTASNVLEIEETVVAVQQAVTEGVVEMSHFVDLVDEGCGTANGVASQMGLIIRQAEELRSEFEHVAHSVEAQSQGVAQVSDAMSRVAEGARRTAEAVERSATVSASLDDAARTLDADVRRFRLPEAAVE